MSSENAYGDLMEPPNVGLITKWARSFGFRDDELPDLEQEIRVRSCLTCALGERYTQRVCTNQAVRELVVAGLSLASGLVGRVSVARTR